MTIHECQVDERVVVEGILDREVSWLISKDGGMAMDTAVMIADVGEVPRVPTADLDTSLGSTVEEIAGALAAKFQMEVLKVCHWPAGRIGDVDVPDSVGVVLATPLPADWFDEDEDDEEEFDVVRAKWIMDGATTLTEAATMLRAYADWLEKIERDGHQLVRPVEDDYGFILPPLPGDPEPVET